MGWHCKDRLVTSFLPAYPTQPPHALPVPGALGPVLWAGATHSACRTPPQPSPKPDGSDGRQAQTRASHRPTWGEGERLGSTGYLPPNAGQAGTARHRTERWEPRAEGNNKKAHVNHSSEPQPRQGTGQHTGAGEKGTCSSGRGYPGLCGH